MDKSKIEIAKTLAEAHLDSIFDKYLVIGFHAERGDDIICNCTDEQLALLLQLFNQRILQTQKPDDPSIN
jgi:hypothetical protein